MLACNISRGTLLARRVRVANSWWSRFRGLMLVPRLAPGEGLLIERCRAVHTHFMRFPIDVLFLGADDTVVGVVRAMPPWRVGRYYREARRVLELPAGTVHATGTQLGDRVRLQSQEARPIRQSVCSKG
jgi:uncharacterized membrane protein (UPF0127 family)